MTENYRIKELILRIMRFTMCQVIIIMVFTGIIHAHVNLAQGVLNQNIAVKVENVKLKAALTQLEKEAKVKFVYSSSQININQIVSINSSKETLGSALEVLLKPLGIKFSVQDNRMIILSKVVDNNLNLLKANGLPNAQAESSQGEEVTGTVVAAESGEPLIGVSVTAKGTPFGTITDEKGRFRVMAKKGYVLLFTYVGYESYSVTVGNATNIKVSLKQALRSLDEVVVIGYGTSSKRINTGSVTSITSAEIGKQPVSNVLAALPGRIAGAQIAQNNGLPGSAVQIQIRGQGSLSSGTIPLYVIDGVPFTNFNGGSPATDNLNAFGISGANGGISPFSMINPNDIERIDILKDADATAIYGSRGANGVVLITTKRGQSGKTKFDVNASTGFTELNRFIPMLSPDQYYDLRTQAFKNDGVTPNTSNAPDLTVWDRTKTTDWQKYFLGGTGKVNDVQTSLSGGDAFTKFMFNLGYRNETTIFPGDYSSTRFSSRLNLDHSTRNKKLNFTLALSYSKDKTNLPQSDLTSVYNLPPNLPLYDANGKMFWSNNFTNPLSTLMRQNNANTSNLISNATVRYNVTKGLNLKANFGYTITDLEQKNLTPASVLNPSSNPTSTLNFADNKAQNYIIEPTAEYVKEIGKGKLLAVVGASWQHNTSNGFSLTATNYSTEALLNTLSGAGLVTVNYNNIVEYKYNAIFGRVNYDWQGKYFVNATFRRDGSSRFGPNNRFGNFGALGAAWVFSQEDFAKSIPALSFGKLRASYGTNGNDQISNYLYLPLYSTSTTYLSNPSLVPTTLPNADIQWETTKKFEAALELGFLKDKVLFTAEYYNNRSGNQIAYLRLPTQSGYNAIQANLPALIENSGWEFEVNTTNISRGDWKWTTTFNITLPQNKLLKFDGLENTFSSSSYIIGQPINFTRVLHYLGVDPKTGAAQYEDINKDGVVDFNDRYVAKIGTPYYGGLGNSVSYKGFQFDIFFQFNHRFGQTNIINTRPGALTNQNASYLNIWKQEGDITTIPGASATAGTAIANSYNFFSSSDAFWGDASYLKMRSASVSYQFPSQIAKAIGMTNCRVFVQGQNLFTWSKNKYILDTETQVSGGPSGLGTGTIGQVLPPLRTIMLGINCSF
ncbi:TonB-dependent receptor [Cellulophaga sp. BC115SP]|uniref:TonB-dependent receptor n=1 Tax=Cellulophaga sp. BC115SP TaxID=2683263 RepID=UPI001412EFA9|nr:TonB-dependent receptor [Cellulophaga sp. BC115SP]NBB29707.1 SusC/RagA family TonB-linked outer membrane protein [Cellulophaga sp. BC115SP]